MKKPAALIKHSYKIKAASFSVLDTFEIRQYYYKPKPGGNQSNDQEFAREDKARKNAGSRSIQANAAPPFTFEQRKNTAKTTSRIQKDYKPFSCKIQPLKYNQEADPECQT